MARTDTFTSPSARRVVKRSSKAGASSKPSVKAKTVKAGYVVISASPTAINRNLKRIFKSVARKAK